MGRFVIAALAAAAFMVGFTDEASAAHLFFYTLNTGLERADEDGANQHVIADKSVIGGGVVSDGTYLYYVHSDGQGLEIGRANLEGGDLNPAWLTGLGFGSSQLAAGGGHVCWGTQYQMTVNISCVDVDGNGNHGSVRPVHSASNRSLGPLAVDSQHLYWGEGPAIAGGGASSIMRAKLDGSELNTTFVPGVFPRGLAVNSTQIFWSVYDPQQLNSSPAAVYAAPITSGGSGSPILTLQPEQGIQGVAANDAHVWWVETPAGGTGFFRNVGRMTPGGGGVNHTFVTRTGVGIGGIATETGGACLDKLDFQTSMIATGCFVRKDDHTYEAIGTVRINGIDFKATYENVDPITFDTKEKTVNCTVASISLSAPGWGSGWFAFQLPAGLHMAFTSNPVTYAYVLKTPLSGSTALDARALGFLQAGGLNPTLFGFPAHAPGVELQFTPGHTSLTVQISVPTTANAFLDPINGLWKVPDGKGGARISYPNSVKARVTANNNDGVDFVEGTFSPADVYGVDTQSKSFVLGESGAPAASVIELAKLRLGWQLAQGAVHLGAVLVIHTSPSEAAKSALPKDFFLGRKVIDLDAALTWWKFNLFGNKFFAPFPTDLAFSVNSINKLVVPEGGFFWQRLSGKFGWDLGDPNIPFRLGAGAGFSWLPRFKHDFLWFQEAASLDVTGEMTFGPFALRGTGDLKVANATVEHGAFVIGPDGLGLTGDMGLDFNQILRVGFPLKLKGIGSLSVPASGGWQVSGEGDAEIYTLKERGKLLWNPDGIGACFNFGAWAGRAIYFDGKWHQGGCDEGPFGSDFRVGIKQTSGPSNVTGKDSADIAAAPVKFKVGKRAKLAGVALTGRGGPPQVKITGPGGLSLALASGTPLVHNGNVVLFANASDSTTYVSFQHAAPGSYTIATLPGSAAIKSTRFAAKLPPPKVSAKVRSVGCQQKLTWNIKAVPGQKVTFVEQTGTQERPLVTTAKHAGSLLFTPLAGQARAHTIIARVEQQQSIRLTKKIGSFKTMGAGAPSRPAHLKGKRKGGKVTLSWSPACAAVSYVVTTKVGKTTAKTTVTKARATVKAGKKAAFAVVAYGAYGAASKPATLKVR